MKGEVEFIRERDGMDGLEVIDDDDDDDDIVDDESTGCGY